MGDVECHSTGVRRAQVCGKSSVGMRGMVRALVGGMKTTKRTAASKPLTADQLYRNRQATCRKLLAAIGGQLKVHAAEQCTRREDYGFCGDLGHVEELLQDVLSFISSGN